MSARIFSTGVRICDRNDLFDDAALDRSDLCSDDFGDLLKRHAVVLPEQKNLPLILGKSVYRLDKVLAQPLRHGRSIRFGGISGQAITRLL